MYAEKYIALLVAFIHIRMEDVYNCGLIVEIFVEIRNSFFYGLYARSRSINLKGTRSMVWKERICSLALFIFTRPGYRLWTKRSL